MTIVHIDHIRHSDAGVIFVLWGAGAREGVWLWASKTRKTRKLEPQNQKTRKLEPPQNQETRKLKTQENSAGGRSIHSTMEGLHAASTAGRRGPDHKMTARPLPTKPDRAHMYGNDHADHHKHAKVLATLLLTTMLLQSPYPPYPVKSCGRAVRSGCQLHQRSRGVFYLEEMLTRDEPKHRDGRQR